MNEKTEKQEEMGVVIYMGDFLLRRKNKLTTDRDELALKAMKISKKDDPRQDPFAGVVMAKADAIHERIMGVDNQLAFIGRGGFGAQIDARGYQLNHPQAAPPPITISFNKPKE